MGRSNERKAQLLTIMRAHRERATCMSEFSRTAIAHEAGVTPQPTLYPLPSAYAGTCGAAANGQVLVNTGC